MLLQVGMLTPEPAATQQLRTGQVGYVITGMKSTRSARLGDTWHLLKQPVEPLPGFKPVKSMVFAGAHALRDRIRALDGWQSAVELTAFRRMRSCSWTAIVMRDSYEAELCEGAIYDKARGHICIVQDVVVTFPCQGAHYAGL